LVRDLFAWTFDSWYHTVFIVFIFFNLLYWGSAITAGALLRWMSKKGMVSSLRRQEHYKGQISSEIKNSLIAIVVFSLQGIFIQQGIQNGWFHLSFEFNLYYLPQVIVLFLWNEIHFYCVHRLLHSSWLVRRVHWVHHHSKEPTVFSTFSFHWVEAFLLGTVIVLPLAVYPFQLIAILSLPVISITLNTLGHCNYELFPGSYFSRLFHFSNRHSLHHKKGRGNYGFMLPWFDLIFRTGIKTKP
jgi:sterol desaturase/sphingolipid hydroxylase (fatty acid hydroxylase superfamily)